MDPRDDRTSSIRTQLTQILIQRMYSPNISTSPGELSGANPLPTQTPQPSNERASPSLPHLPPSSVPSVPSVAPAYAHAPVTVGTPSTQLQSMQSGENRGVSVVRSVNSPLETAKEVPSSPMTYISTSPRPTDAQSVDAMSLTRSTNLDTSSAISPIHPPSGVDDSLTRPVVATPVSSPPSQSQVELGINTIRETQQLAKSGMTTSFPRSNSVTSPSPSIASSNFQQHPTILPLYPRTKSPQAISPSRSPPLPPTPKQLVTPHEIKQPMPLNPNFTNSSVPVASNINDLVNEPGKEALGCIICVLS